MTREMLKDRGTLQFILDTVYKLGGAPQKLDLAQEESMYYSKLNFMSLLNFGEIASILLCSWNAHFNATNSGPIWFIASMCMFVCLLEGGGG